MLAVRRVSEVWAYELVSSNDDRKCASGDGDWGSIRYDRFVVGHLRAGSRAGATGESICNRR